MNSLKSLEGKLPCSLKGIKEALAEAGIDPKLRPETLSIKDFIRLADALYLYSATKTPSHEEIKNGSFAKKFGNS